MSGRIVWKAVLGLVLAATGWWLIRRVWLVKEATEAEPPTGTPARAPVAPSVRHETARPDPVDEAIAESFPASDPPSFAGARGHGDIGL